MIDRERKRLVCTILIIASFGIIILLSSCTHCSDCADNLSAVYKNCKYKNNDIVVFVNDASVERRETVSLGYTPVPDHYCYSTTGNEPVWQLECVGRLNIQLGNYKISNETNLYTQSKVQTAISFFDIDLTDSRYTSEISDYNYNGSIVKTKHFTLVDALDINMQEYCTDCRIASSDNQLFSFSVNNLGTIENWRLK